jgi:hypothetical protein
LKILKDALKSWAKSKPNLLVHNKTLLVKKLDEIGDQMEFDWVSLEILEEEKKTFKSYQDILKTEEEHWRLKSRSLWLQVDDKNTKFFHRQTKARLWKNRVAKITSVNGEVLSDFNQIKLASFQHFEDLYKEDLNINLDSFKKMLDSIPSLIQLEDNDQLCKPISE